MSPDSPVTNASFPKTPTIILPAATALVPIQIVAASIQIVALQDFTLSLVAMVPKANFQS